MDTLTRVVVMMRWEGVGEGGAAWPLGEREGVGVPVGETRTEGELEGYRE